MFKNVKIIARKEKFVFEDGKEIDCFKLVEYFDNYIIELRPSKSYIELLKQMLGFDAMEYDKDYLVYSNVGGAK